MRKYLLPETGNFYKANLHNHTTLSDGKATPEQIKDIYKRHGYSVVAFTDHNVQIPHPELRDADFLPLTGTEVNINAPGYPGKDREIKTCHLCFIAERDDIPYQVCFTESYCIHGGAKENIPNSQVNPNEPDFVREYTPECINTMIRTARKAGYFVTYNHPTWSRQDYSDYMQYHGMNAMEIYNHDCAVAGYPEYNARVYDDMLHGGERIGCVAADDNHNKHPEGDPHCDSCGGWVMIKADRLEYNTVGAALEAGNYYASTGPEIKALWFEGNRVYVECSPAAKICIINSAKVAKAKYAAETEGPLTAASFEVKPNHKWFRIHVEDEHGCFADSSAYYMEDMPFELPEETK